LRYLRSSKLEVVSLTFQFFRSSVKGSQFGRMNLKM
jgi:hypothetical protein